MNQKIITNSSKEDSLLEYIKRIIHNYELAIALVKKDIIVKLSKTLLGKLWLVIQPLITIFIYSVFFGQLLKIDTGSSPYPLFLISGLTLWNYFSQSTSMGGNALMSNQDIIKKTPFPKIILNISSALFTLLEQVPLLIILIIIAFYYQRPSFSQLFFAPFIYFFTILFSLSISNILAILSIKKRDLSYAYNFFLQVLLWTTPVFYPVTLIPEKYIFIVYLNPIAGLLDLFRWSLNIMPIENFYFVYSIISIVFIFIFSIILYKKSEKSISDYI